jgi:hypothetical protein
MSKQHAPVEGVGVVPGVCHQGVDVLPPPPPPVPGDCHHGALPPPPPKGGGEKLNQGGVAPRKGGGMAAVGAPPGFRTMGTSACVD